MLLVLTACSDDDHSANGGAQAVTFVVNEEPWQDEGVMMTRSTYSDLQGTGFNLYSSELSLDGVSTTWDTTNKRWRYEGQRLWPQGVTTASFYALTNAGSASLDVSTEIITISAFYASPPDLLYASHKNVARGNNVELTFHHIFAKVTMGTVTIDPNSLITSVSNVTFGATLDNQGTFSLKDDATYATFTSQSGDVAVSGQTFYPTGTSLLVIPDENVTITLTLTCDPARTLTVSKTLTLDSGKNYILNVHIGPNHEVVIE